MDTICAAQLFILANLEALEDRVRMDWLMNECRNGSVLLIINGQPRGFGKNVRDAVDDAISIEKSEREVEREFAAKKRSLG